MIKLFLIVFLMTNAVVLHAQRIETIVTRQPVVAGNAFQVQYVIKEPAELTSIQYPEFTSFKKVSGPHVYKGKMIIGGRSRIIENITYTLVATVTGPQKVNGLRAVFKNEGMQKSADAWITVVMPQKASFTNSSSYTDVALFSPASTNDRAQLIRDNLFVKTEVSRKKCFSGEPVVVTFTLYSRLQSTSEVINAPSLYGFSVTDLLDINQAHLFIDTLDGKIFNAAILRKLQLYPAQAGQLLIDPMQLRNEVEFDDSAGKENKTSIETFISSPEKYLTVVPLPGNVPESFTGAVGHFSINATLSDSIIVTGKQAQLTVTVSGSGNFIQLAPPTIMWPEKLDVFEPSITDHINQNTIPVEGAREYKFGFTSQQVGHFTLPPVSFSFFEPSARKYITVTTKGISIQVIQGALPVMANTAKKAAQRNLLWLLLGALPILTYFFYQWYRHRKRRQLPAMRSPVLPADLVLVMEGMPTKTSTCQEVCERIQKILVSARIVYPGITREQNKVIQSIQDDCHLYAYSPANNEEKKEDLKNRTLLLLKQIQADHSAYL